LGAWVAQSVRHRTLGFGPGHDLRGMGASLVWGSVLGGESAWDSLALPLPLPCMRVHALSLSKNK